MRIQFWHIIVLLLVVLLLFGSSRLPDLARSVGKSMKIFKAEVRELREDTPEATTPPTTSLGGTAAPPTPRAGPGTSGAHPDDRTPSDSAAGDPGPRDH